MAPSTHIVMDTLDACEVALEGLRRARQAGKISQDDFWCELEVITDHARSIQGAEPSLEQTVERMAAKLDAVIEKLTPRFA